MTFSLLKAQVLLKAARIKLYDYRIPKVGGGYKYYYKKHRGGGMTRAKFEEGAAFKLTWKNRRGHFHIKKIEGDMVTISHDSRPDVDIPPIHKDELRAILKKQHGKAEEKSRAQAQENRRRGRKKRKGSKRTKRKTAAPQTQAPEQTPQVQDRPSALRDQAIKRDALESVTQDSLNNLETQPFADLSDVGQKALDLEAGANALETEMKEASEEERKQIRKQIKRARKLADQMFHYDRAHEMVRNTLIQRAKGEQVEIPRGNKKLQSAIDQVVSDLKERGSSWMFSEQTPQVQETEQGADNFETMPESTGTPLKADGSLDLEKMTPDQIKEHLKYQSHVGLQVLTKSPEFQDLLKEAQQERKRGSRARSGSAQDRLNNAVSDIYGPFRIVPREQISEALGFKVVMTGDVYGAFEAGTAGEIMDAKFEELGRKFGEGEDVPPVPYSNWLKQVEEVKQEAYKKEDQRALVALKGASVGDVITYQNIPFEVRTIEEHKYRGTTYGVRLSDPETHTPKKAPVSATFDVKGDQLKFDNNPLTEKAIRYYEGDFDRGIDPNTDGENMKESEAAFYFAWRTQTREEALKTPYEIPADKIPASLKTEQGADNFETMPEPDPSPAREQLTETARSGGLSTEDVKEMDEAVDRFRFTPEEIQSMNLDELAEIREAFTEVFRDPRRKYYNDPEYKALSEADKTAVADKDRTLSEALDIMDEMDDMENRFNARHRDPLSDLIKPIDERLGRLQRNKRARERRAEKKQRTQAQAERQARREEQERKKREEQARIDEATNRRMITQDDAREMLGKPRKYRGSPAREQLTETAREVVQDQGVETPPVKKKRARKPKKFGSSIPSKDELLEEFKGITESYQIVNEGNPVLSQVFKVLNSPNTTKEQKNKFKRGLNLPLLNLNSPYEVESYLSERETRTGRGSDLFLPSALKAHGTSLDPFNVSEQAQEETGKVYNLYSSPSATNEESGLAFAFGTIKAEGVKPKRGLWAIHRDSGRLALVDDTVKPHQAPAILTFLGEELKDQLAKMNPDNPEHMKIFGRATKSVSLARQQRQADLAEMLARILNDPRLNKSLIGLNLLDLYKALRC